MGYPSLCGRFRETPPNDILGLVELLVADDRTSQTRYLFSLDFIGRRVHDICHPAQ